MSNGMSKLVAWGLVVGGLVGGRAAPALAAPPAPGVVVLPTSVLNPLLQYLASRPWGEVDGIITQLQPCLKAQAEGAEGVGCPEIKETMQELAVTKASHSKEPGPPPVISNTTKGQ